MKSKPILVSDIYSQESNTKILLIIYQFYEITLMYSPDKKQWISPQITLTCRKFICNQVKKTIIIFKNKQIHFLEINH